MFPWLWYLAPRFHFPFGGSVTQDISPATEWFFGSIKPEAGDGEIEKQVFDMASYGRQLGLITEVLLALADEQPLQGEEANKSLERLKGFNERIEKVKENNRQRTVEAAIQLLEKLKKSDRKAYQRVLDCFSLHEAEQ